MADPQSPNIELAGVVINSAVITPFRLTNGRNNLLELLGQSSVTFSCFRQALNGLFTTTPISDAGLGAAVQLYSGGAAPQLRVWFNGIVTDVSSDADTITFTAIDLNTWYLSKAPPLDLAAGSYNSDVLIQTLCNAVSVDYAISAGIDAPQYIDAQTVTNYADFIRTIIGGNATAFGYFAPPGDQPSVGLKIVDRETDVIYPAATAAPAQTDVEKNYSITRSIGDILNEIVITYSDGAGGTLTSSSVNQTSIDDIGVRSYSRSVLTTDADEVKRIEKGLMAAGAPYGFPLVNLRVHSSFFNGTPLTLDQSFDYFQPNSRLNLTDLISQPGFDSIMFVEQVTWNFSKADTTIDLLCSSEQYSTMPQEWQNLTGSTTWASISSFGYTWDDLLYTRL